MGLDLSHAGTPIRLLVYPQWLLRKKGRLQLLTFSP